jgi:antitoxin HicB
MAEFYMKKKSKYKYKYLLNVRWSEDDQCYFGEFPELSGCATHGDSVEEVIRNANDAVETWLEAASLSGIEMPEPISLKKWSGVFTTRINPEIHRMLAIKARQAGKTVNKFVKEILEYSVV